MYKIDRGRGALGGPKTFTRTDPILKPELCSVATNIQSEYNCKCNSSPIDIRAVDVATLKSRLFYD